MNYSLNVNRKISLDQLGEVNQIAVATVLNSNSDPGAGYDWCDEFLDLLRVADNPSTTPLSLERKNFSANNSVGTSTITQGVADVELTLKNYDVPRYAKTVNITLKGVTSSNFITLLDNWLKIATSIGGLPSNLYNHNNFIIVNAIFTIK